MTSIAIQGINGSYSYEAARQIAGDDGEILECSDFDQVFLAVLDGHAEYAVIPVLNKIVGQIAKPVELISMNGMTVHKEMKLAIEHVLAAWEGTAIDEIEIVRSHPEALKQCSRYLSEHPNWKVETGADTAGSLRSIVEKNERNAAAICSRKAAELYEARIVAAAIADDADNWTMFQLVGKK